MSVKNPAKRGGKNDTQDISEGGSPGYDGLFEVPYAKAHFSDKHKPYTQDVFEPLSDADSEV